MHLQFSGKEICQHGMCTLVSELSVYADNHLCAIPGVLQNASNMLPHSHMICIKIPSQVQHIRISSGWWFGTFGLFLHSVGNVIFPTDEVHHFSVG